MDVSIDNQYAYQIEDIFDIEHLIEIAYRQINTDPSKPHHRGVRADSDYLMSLREKYSFLAPTFSVYNLADGIPPHTDLMRQCAINIPINNTADSETIFYEMPEDIMGTYTPDNSVLLIENANLIEVFKYTLTKPILTNVTVVHRVVNHSEQPRASISWSINDLSYQQARDSFR